VTTATGSTAAQGETELRVGPLELFFDLVFVFTITQLTASLVHHLTPGGLVRVLVMLAVIWWMYDAFIWLTNALPPSTHPRRGFLLLGMTATIQIFIYPEAWPTHIQWLAFMIVLVLRGPGRLSLDALIGPRLVGRPA